MTTKNNKSYWDLRWRDLNTPWDYGNKHPLLDQLIEKANLPEKARIYVPGCGRAHDAAAFAHLGFSVIAEDIVSEAVEEAKKLYGEIKNLRIEVRNIFEKDETNAFDAIFDRAVLCALPTKMHERYLSKCFQLLAPGGLFISIPFLKLTINESEGPPYEIPEEKLKEYLANKFSLQVFDKIKNTPVGASVILEQGLLIAAKESQ